MTLEEMTVQRDALLGVRFRSVGTVEMDGRHVTFGTDAETAAAISDPIDRGRNDAGELRLRASDANRTHSRIGDELNLLEPLLR